VVGLVWRHRNRRAQAPAAKDVAQPAAAEPEPVRQAWLTIALRPVRAGLNLVTAVADCEITITNVGDAAAEDIRPVIALLGAGPGQGADLAAGAEQPAGRAILPAFALAPGESRVIRAVASASIDDLPTLTAGQGAGRRELLVPIVHVGMAHRDADGATHRTAQAFVIGVEQAGAPKLAPFWLDTLRMVDQVAARPTGDAVRSRTPAPHREA
jgi:hypothetical protein